VSAFALSAYPLSGAFREELSARAGEEIEVVVIAELRRLGPSALVRRLRTLRGACVLPIEDPSSAALLPVLQTLALLTRASSIDVVERSGTTRRITRAAAVGATAALAAASADAQRALRRAGRELDGLLAAPRRAATVESERVLYLNANLWFGVMAGGSIAHVAGVANALVARGRELTLATAPEPVGVVADAAVRRLRPPRTFALPVESNLYRFGLTVPRQVRDLPAPGFVYHRLSVGSYAGVAVARAHGVPLVIEYNGSEVWIARNWGRPLRFERLALAAERVGLRHAKLVVTISQALADELRERGVEEERIVWHPNGVDADVFAPAGFTAADRDLVRRRYAIPADASVVTFVGTFGQWHGVDVLARAIRGSADWARRANVRFLLVGDGLKMADVRREVEGLDDVVVLAGLVPQEEAPRHLAASDILVSPHVPNEDGSPFFGSPTKLFEYMAAGKAIVASDLDQIGDVLRGGTALLVRPGDPNDLARAIRELVADPGLRATLGARARALVLARYTWDHHVAAILERLD
jgi:glycosyltransferase involved in cell wall biosynthesis